MMIMILIFYCKLSPCLMLLLIININSLQTNNTHSSAWVWGQDTLHMTLIIHLLSWQHFPQVCNHHGKYTAKHQLTLEIFRANPSEELELLFVTNWLLTSCQEVKRKFCIIPILTMGLHPRFLWILLSIIILCPKIYKPDNVTVNLMVSGRPSFLRFPLNYINFSKILKTCFEFWTNLCIFMEANLLQNTVL